MNIVYEWIRNIVVYMILNTIIMNLLGRSNYKKYVNVASGMILVIIVISPLLSLLKLDDKIDYFFQTNHMVMESSEFENQLQYVEGRYRDTILAEYKETITVGVQEVLQKDGIYLTQLDVTIEDDENSEQYGEIVGLTIHGSYEEEEVTTAMIGQIDRIDISKIEFEESNQKEENEMYSPSEISVKNKLSDVYNINPANINISIQGG